MNIIYKFNRSSVGQSYTLRAGMDSGAAILIAAFTVPSSRSISATIADPETLTGIWFRNETTGEVYPYDIFDPDVRYTASDRTRDVQTNQLVQGIAGGAGTYLLNIKVEDTLGNAVQGVTVQLEGTTLYQVTNTLGIANFHVNNGEYSVIVVSNSDYEEADSVLVEIEGAGQTLTIPLTRRNHDVPGQPGMVYVDVYTVDVIGQKVAGIPVTLTIRDKFVVFEGVVPTSFEQTINSDVNGRARFIAIPSSKVRPVTSISTHLVTIQGVIRYLIVSDSGGNAATMFRRT